MSYLTELKEKSKKYNSIICMGLDPVLDDIPEQGTIEERIYNFYEKILNKIVAKNIYPASVKPNYAFYAQYGIDGINALSKIIDIYKNEGLHIILDVKRGDIGKTAAAYAKESFDFFKADAVTLAPYMGLDSIAPFMDNYPGKGYYVLTKTSNPSSGDIQDLKLGNKELYLIMAEKLIEWYQDGLGSVVGATYSEQLSSISDIFINSGKEIPMLIPGVGTQGGSLSEVVDVLKRFSDPRIHRINSSSGINYAYKKYSNLNYDDAAVKALKELNDNIEL